MKNNKKIVSILNSRDFHCLICMCDSSFNSQKRALSTEGTRQDVYIAESPETHTAHLRKVPHPEQVIANPPRLPISLLEKGCSGHSSTTH